MAELRELTGAPEGRRFPAGAEIVAGGTSFRVWAPDHQRVTLVLEGGGKHDLPYEGDGYFSAVIADIGAAARYRFRLGDNAELLADPASRWQPDGPKGPSEVVASVDYDWQQIEWPGLRQKGQVIYELHIGTFTPEGTFAAAMARLPELADVGVTTVELLPINEFVGDFGWGYDGVLLYAPSHLYGTPDDVRRFVDRAHALGLGVILDVVYNHFGAGDRFSDFSTRYFMEGSNEWGKSLCFDPTRSMGAREYVVGNALYWIEEFHFDGFRLDATQALIDLSAEHVMAEMARKARLAAGGRSIVIMGENEPQNPVLVRSVEKGGYGLDGIWNEDFHHSATAAATLSSEGYMHDQLGRPQEFVSMAKYGFLFQGQRYNWQDNFRGHSARDVRPEQIVGYLQNHDQIANSAVGRRLWGRISPGRARAITTFFLLMPQTPILFQGQEFASSSPFFYFLDSDPELRKAVTQGRIEFMKQFPGSRDPALLKLLPDPADPSAFRRSKLDWADREAHADVLALHRDLLRMRREHAAFSRQPHGASGEIDGAVIGNDALILHYFAEKSADERLVAFNFGRDIPVRSIPDPLVAPPDGLEWELIWSTGDARYGGEGIWPVDMAERWTFRAETALVFAPTSRRRRQGKSKEDGDRYQQTIF